jgi:hypothetical protein
MCICSVAPKFPEAGVHFGPKLRLGELVNKIETTRTQLKKRVGKMAKKLRKATRQHVRMAKEKGLYAVCLTLTYSKAEDFNKNHVSKFLAALRMKLNRLGHKLPYLWVLERAPLALHYHFTLWLPRGFKLDSSDLSKWWKHGSTWVAACKKVRAWTEYLSKRESKERLPISARMYGIGGLDTDGRKAVARASMPLWLIALVPQDASVRRCPGGWLLKETGELLTSPFEWTPWGCRLKA